MNKRLSLVIIIILCLSILPFQYVSAKTDKTIIRVGFFEREGYQMMDEDGRRSGYGYEYLQKMSLSNNWTYEYIGYDKCWKKMLEMLEAGEIDLLTFGKKTKELEERFDFSAKPIGSYATIFTVKEGNTRYLEGDYKNFNGIRIGMVSDSGMEESLEEFAGENQFTYELVYYDSLPLLVEALIESSEVDAIISSSMRNLNDEWILAEFNVTSLYAMVKKGNYELLHEVNDAIEQTYIYYPGIQMELFTKYYRDNNTGHISFTLKEREYIKKLQEAGTVIKAAMKPEYLPLSGFKNGQAEGIIADIAAKIEQRTGLTFEIIETANRSEYTKLCQSDEITIILDCVAGYGESEKYNCKITDTFLVIPFATLTKGNEKDINTIAAVRGAMISMEYLPDHVSLDQIVYYDTNQECIEAVRTGKQDVTYQNLYTAERVVLQDETNQLTYRLFEDFTLPIAVAVKNTADTELLTILNKVMYHFGESTKDIIINEQSSHIDQPVTLIGYIYDNPILLTAVFSMIFITIIIMIGIINTYKRGKLNAQRKKEYAQLISYICKANSEVSEINVATMKRYRYHMENGEVVQEEQVVPKEVNRYEMVHPEDREAVRKYYDGEEIKKLVEESGEAYFECRMLEVDGTYQWYAYMLQGIPKDEKHPFNFMVFKRDINNAKMEEDEKRRQLMDALSVAQRASEAKGTFMSRMSHEIRTPLNAAIGYMTIAKRSVENDSFTKVNDCISKAEAAAKQLLSIINEVLDMSAIESGKMKVANESFDFKQLVSATSTIFYHQAMLKNVQFSTVLNGITKEQLIGDQMRLNQILMNLLSNAIKFTPEGGAVFLKITQGIVQKDTVYMNFVVSDNGIGMKKEFMEKLFSPFEQQDATISQKYGGTGLGLSITKNLVTMMKGDINVESIEGKGSTFTVELPFGIDQEKTRVQEETKASDVNMAMTKPLFQSTIYDLMVNQHGKYEVVAPERVREYHFTGRRLLLVEDNIMNLEIAYEILTEAGFTVDCAKDGAEAVDCFVNSEPGTYQIILMDIQMPKMNGYESTMEIRRSSHPDASTVQILAMTANVFTEEISKSISSGMNNHIAKPIDADILFQTLVKHLNE